VKGRLGGATWLALRRLRGPYLKDEYAEPTYSVCWVLWRNADDTTLLYRVVIQKRASRYAAYQVAHGNV
jgi:hypothetical protein